jgi:hypothetical protein
MQAERPFFMRPNASFCRSHETAQTRVCIFSWKIRKAAETYMEIGAQNLYKLFGGKGHGIFQDTLLSFSR